MGAIGEFLSSLGLGSMTDGKFALNTDALGSLMGGAGSIWSGMQAGDMMDFNQDMAKKSMNMQQDVFNMNKEDREKNQNLDFSL